MKVLIIGMGYAGRRYLRAWKNVARQKQIPLEVAYYSRRNKNNSVKYYDCFATALTDFCPDVLVIAVTDGWHYEVIEQLIEYKGFVICEKPFIGHEDSLVDAGAKLVQCSGFCLDMVEEIFCRE